MKQDQNPIKFRGKTFILLGLNVNRRCWACFRFKVCEIKYVKVLRKKFLAIGAEDERKVSDVYKDFKVFVDTW